MGHICAADLAVSEVVAFLVLDLRKHGHEL